VSAPAIVMGIPIDRVSMSAAVDEIERLARVGRARGISHQVVTVNVDFVVNAIAHRDVMRILQTADLALADGMPLVWASSRIGAPIPERVTGADLVPALAARSAETGLRLHLFGSADGVAERARALLLERCPGAQISADSGPIIRDPRAPDDSVVQRLAEVDADVVCVALGNPKQEHLIAAIGAKVGAPVMIGIGGTLDMLVGGRKRAPRWMQRTGLEWIFRALQEPRRLGKRYANDIFVFGPRLAMFLWRTRDQRSIAAPALVAVGSAPIVVDLTGVDTLPLAALGELVAMRRNARENGTRLELTGVGEALRRRMRAVSAEALLADQRVAP
jgi:N-acetylglucosaminyldiphosphoundecaprenol N-acetyl-beta-D-mannosaminyltransferase